MSNQNNQRKNKLYYGLIAFFGGLFGVSIIFIVFYLIFDVARLENPFPPTFWGVFFSISLLNSFIEEGTKFLLIKRNIGQFPYGFLLGLGFGLGEAILTRPLWEFGIVSERRIPAILLHIIAAGILSYAIKKNKPALGLLTAITLHTGFNLVAYYANAQ